ncbi:PREDICTED: cytochrome P450 9e2-like [Dinoponera quadriceps]|uniref:Cytochrome P450 9e2-like n=1 Tax=Dinoponera quadriceps TaxID=609295 RepID=A0A6P3XDG6_DINQU|nr:PREDICTED: cytochrome P450 9e2-like [Dinoponera quadriceps]
MEFWVLLSLLASGYAVYRYCFKGLDYFKKHGIHHVSPWPVLGNLGPMFLCQTSMAELLKKVYDMSPNAKYVGFFDAMNPVVMIRDPELIKSIAVKNFEIFPEHRSFIDEVNDPMLGKNLFSLRGDKWRELRKLLSLAFTSGKMKTTFELMSNCAADFADFLSKMPTDKNVVELKDSFTRYTNDVIATCVFGISVDSMRNPKNDFYMYGMEATTFTIITTIKFYLCRSMPFLCKILSIKTVSNQMTRFFNDIVRNTMYTREVKNIVRPDILQLMMDSRGKRGSGKELTIQDITSQAFLFFIGGFETASTLMCFAALEITTNSDVQAKLRAEVDAVMKATDGTLTYEAVKGMQYLDAVMNEALRMYPAVLFLDRVCVKEFKLPPALPGDKPHVLKKGSTVWFPVYALHHDPKNFEDPASFRPERFLDEDKMGFNPDAYLPFGIGPRMCIGKRFALLETKVMLVHLLARCELKRCEKTVYPIRLSKKKFTILAEGGSWIKIQPRSDALNVVSPNTVSGSAANVQI